MSERNTNVMFIVVPGTFIVIITGIIAQTISDYGIIFQIIGFLSFLIASSNKPWEKYEKCRKPVKVISIWLVVVGLIIQFSRYESGGLSLMIESILG